MTAAFSNNVTVEVGADSVRFVFNDERGAVLAGIPKAISTVAEVVVTRATAHSLFKMYVELAARFPVEVT